MWYKEGGEYVSSENTRKLFKEFERLNNNKDGLFSSSTELNRGCLVDITKSKKIQEIIKMNKQGKKRFGMKMGGALKPVDPKTQKGLSKLPTEVRNKMGYMKKGGKVHGK